MSIKAGGLGLQHPSTCAVTQFMLRTKRCHQYCHEGVWLEYNKHCPALPHTVTSLFDTWKTTQTRTMLNFRTYVEDFASVCFGSAEFVDQFVHAAKMTREVTLERTAPEYVLPKLNQCF